MDFARPDSVDEALTLLRQGRWSLLAGGTDFYPALGERRVTEPVLDLTALRDLRDIQESGEAWRIGALTTWSDLVRAELPPAFDALKLAALEIGSVQIQNRATLAGNLCNASPAADGVPALLILDAEVELSSEQGVRVLPLGDFIQGNRKTLRRDDELLTAILIPKAACGGRSHFLKLGARRYLVISIAMVAARLAHDVQGRVSAAAVSVGACSAVAQRLPALEAALLGQPWSATLVETVTAAHLADLAPIDDVRAPADYRSAAAEELVRRTLLSCLGEAGS